MKIVLIQRLVPTYREVVFDRMRAQCEAAGDTFELWTSDPPEGFTRRGTHGAVAWATRVPVWTLLGGIEWQRLAWRDVLECDVLILPDQLRTFSNIAAMLLRRLAGKPVLTWGHGRNFQPNVLSRALAILRFRLMAFAHGHLLYTEQCRAAMLAEGVALARLRVVENAPDTRGSEGLYPRHDLVRAFRSQWTLGEAPCIAFLGSWYSDKRPEWIILIGEQIRRGVPDARVVVIGGGDGLATLRAAAPSWLVLTGPLHGRDKFVALSACHCLCIRGVAGLNVLDAMTMGLPVVLPRRADHSPEAIYVRHDVNGRWAEDDPAALAAACLTLIADRTLADRLGEQARTTAAALTADVMARNLLAGAISLSKPAIPVSVRPVVFVYQRMLPYHRARFLALAAALAARGRPCVALEVTNADSSYGEFADTPLPAGAHVVTLFPNIDYLKLSAPHVARSVRQALHALGTVSVFAPAPAFAEGAGALHHKVDRGGTLFQMDDAWSATDHRGRLTRIVKRWFNGYVDGGFLPDKLHGRYFETLNIPADRQAYAVDAVADADEAGPSSDHERTDLLFVGRLIARKGLDSVLRAMAQLLPESPRLVVIGDGPERAGLQQLAIDLGISGCVVWLGRQSNAEARNWMRHARVLVVPSSYEQWGLVINEAWQSGLPVLGSTTVGALRAALPASLTWTMLPAVGDADAWAALLRRVASIDDAERQHWIEIGHDLARRYSLERHVDSALHLLDLPARPRPWFVAGLLARAWTGRVVIW